MPIFGGFCVCSRALGGRWVRWVNMVAFLPSIPVVEDLRALVGRVDTARHHGVPNGCVLEFNLRSVPPETTGFDPLTVLTGGGRPMALRDAVAAIHRAAEDPRVAGLIARVQLPPSPAGAVQELREAIAAFSAVKPSLAWAETYPGTLSYYLASAFGEVWMQPSGSVGLVGFATNATFLRDALHKAGIEAQFVARGEYKSAANLFTEDGFTDAHREAVTRMLDSLQDQVWQAVAKSRNIGVDALDELADRAPLLRDDAVTCGLIDRIGFRDQAYARMAELVGVEKRFTGIQWLANKPRRKAAADVPGALRQFGPATADAPRPIDSWSPVQADDRGGDPGRPDRQRSWWAPVSAARSVERRR